jgi:hypothetical protein
LELEEDKRFSAFYLGHFSLSKSFNHITKDANMFHLKSSDSHKLCYFLTFTLSKHTSYHHNQPIASHWFLHVTLRNTPPITTTNLLQVVGF